MKALITGGTGFIGNNLARMLISDGNKVGLLIRKDSKSWRVKDLSGKVDFLEGDLTDRGSLTRLVQSYNPNFIYHFGAYGTYPGFQRDENAMLAVNVGGTINLIDAARGIPIINIGSSSEYGIKNSAMTETDRCNPNNWYGKTKLMQTIYCSEQMIPTLRLFSVYGPWEEPTRLIPSLIRAKLNSEKLHLIDSVREYAYIDDITKSFLMATRRYNQIMGEIINVGSGQQYTMRKVLEELDKINPKKLDVNWDFESIQLEPKVWIADISKAERLLNFKPNISLEEGLKRTYEWWKQWKV